MLRGSNKWLPGYLASVLRRPSPVDGVRHLLFCVADHFEPLRDGLDPVQAGELTQSWIDDYRRRFAGFADADGRPPRHTFFFPGDAYDPGCVDHLAGLCRDGMAEVEIHLHHRHDTTETLADKLVTFRDVLRTRHGLLGTDRHGHVRYGFVHGNWALCNARPDGDWCGVSQELGVLTKTGCYADFTFPSAPSPTQPRMVNAIYYARDRANGPRGADCGRLLEAEIGEQKGSRKDAKAHGRGSEDALMLIQGPLALNWRRRKWGVLPRLENADLTGANPPTAARLHLWVRQQIGVRGRPDWVFVKLHTHGFVPANRRVILGPEMEALHQTLCGTFNDGVRWQLHYVTAREMYNMARAAEDGWSGLPGECRDYEIRALC